MKNRKILILICLLFAATTVAGLFAACNKNTRGVYFSQPIYHHTIGSAEVFTPEVITVPRGKRYTLTSLNTSIAKVQPDGKSIKPLREGSVILTAEVDGHKGECKLLVYSSKESSVIPTVIDGKVSVFFVSEEGSFLSQRLKPGSFAIDPASEYTRPGYTLYGWYTEPEYKNKFDFTNTKITKNITLFALWGIDTPIFNFERINEETYVTGLKYGFIPYENLTLPEKDEYGRDVVGITSESFKTNAHIKSIVIPSTYREIGDSAFTEMQELESVTINADITSIHNSAFAKNPKLRTVNITGAGELVIGTQAFLDCRSLEILNIPNTTKKIEAYAFDNCLKLKTFDTPTSLTFLGDAAFANSGLTAIDLKNIEELGTQTFWGCINLASVDGIKTTKIGSYAFGKSTSSDIRHATKWLATMDNNDQSVKKSNLLYLGTTLVYAYGGLNKPVYYVKEETTSIASRAFADTPGAIIFFKGDIPPTTIGDYVFGGERGDETCKSEIIIPNGKMEAYINAFIVKIESIVNDATIILPTEYSFSTVNHFYEKEINKHMPASLEIFTRKEVKWKDSSTGEWINNEGKLLMLIGGVNLLFENEVIPLELDVKKETDEIAKNESYIVERIVGSAFTKLNVEKIILPLYIKNIDSNAFSELTSCTGIYFRGEFEWNPAHTHILQHSFNFSLMRDCKIYVPADKVNSYKIYWNHSNIVSRTFADSV